MLIPVWKAAGMIVPANMVKGSNSGSAGFATFDAADSAFETENSQFRLLVV